MLSASEVYAKDVFMSFRKYCRGMSQHELLDYSILQKANLRNSLQMAYLWQLFRKNQRYYEQLVNATALI